MWRWIKISIAMLLCLNVSLPVVFAEESERVYRSATEYDYPPFSVTESGEADGFSVELLKAVAEETGIRLTFRIDEWSVIKDELMNGELDVLPLVSYSEERDEYFDFSVPYIVMYGNIFVRSDNDTIQTEEDLFGKEIAVMSEDTAHEYALRMDFTDRLVLTSTFQEAFQQLNEGKIDAVLAQSLVGEKIISDMGLNNIKAVNQFDDDGVSRVKTRLSGFEQKFCFAVKEGDGELLAKLNEGLAVVSVNGTYNQLYEKWFPFLLDRSPSMEEIVKYLVYILVPALLLMMGIFIITVKKEVKRKTLQLEQANEAKSRFLADMSHELRTPLNAILGYSTLMQKDSGLSSQNSHNLSVINNSGKHLLSLINDILEITKIESQKSVLKHEVFDIHLLVEEIEAMFALEVQKKNLRMEIQGILAIPRYVMGDSLKLRIILINLVGNAVKFTEQGAIILRFSLQERIQDRFRMLVEIEDTGPGIAEEEMIKLFQLFSQTETGRKQASGSGLGLVISQESVHMMGGKIEVDSHVDEGSRFYFSIDLQEAELSGIDGDAGENKRNHYRITGDSQPPVVLVVEDTTESRELLALLLREAGCTVLEAANGEEAIAIAKAKRPEFIWMDIRMPVMDGLTATRQIKAMEQEYKTVIVVISAHVFEEERDSILAAGADDMLGKPFLEHDVFRMMEKHLQVSFVPGPVRGNRLAGALIAIGEEERSMLKEALLLLDTDRLQDLIERIELRDSEAAKIISRELEKMNYTLLLKELRTDEKAGAQD